MLRRCSMTAWAVIKNYFTTTYFFKTWNLHVWVLVKEEAVTKSVSLSTNNGRFKSLFLFIIHLTIDTPKKERVFRCAITKMYAVFRCAMTANCDDEKNAQKPRMSPRLPKARHTYLLTYLLTCIRVMKFKARWYRINIIIIRVESSVPWLHI